MWILILISSVFCQTAKVTLTKGDVTKLLPHSLASQPVKLGEILPMDTSLVTGAKSILRVQFQDNSTMNLGPNSKIVLTEMATDKANMVSFLTGVIKAEVKKHDKQAVQQEIKMLIKTKNAAMGVRGTKFQTTFNPVNNNTSLVTVEGEVAMAKIEEHPMTEAKELTQTLNNEKEIVSVKPGQYSAVSTVAEAPVEPVKIAPEQFETMAKSMGETQPVAVNAAPVEDGVKPGGFVDFQTGLYVPPPADAAFDEKNQVYVSETKIGEVDQESGDYIPPKGVELDAKKGFIITDEASKEVKETLVAMNSEMPIQENTMGEKIEAPEKNKSTRNWYLDAGFTALSEKNEVKHKDTDSKATFLSSAGRLVTVGATGKWNKNWSTQFIYSHKDIQYETESGVSVDNGVSESLKRISFATSYKINPASSFLFALSDEDYIYFKPGGENGKDISKNKSGVTSLDLSYARRFAELMKIQWSWHGDLFFMGGTNNGGDKLGSTTGFGAGLLGNYSYSKTLKFKPEVTYKTFTQKGPEFEVQRAIFALAFNANWDF